MRDEPATGMDLAAEPLHIIRVTAFLRVATLLEQQVECVEHVWLSDKLDDCLRYLTPSTSKHFVRGVDVGTEVERALDPA